MTKYLWVFSAQPVLKLEKIQGPSESEAMYSHIGRTPAGRGLTASEVTASIALSVRGGAREMKRGVHSARGGARIFGRWVH